MSTKSESYRQLIEQFVKREVTALQFESAFLARYKNEPEGMSESLFLVLDNLFGDVDRFCADDELRGDDDLDEEGLRQACKRTLEALVSL